MGLQLDADLQLDAGLEREVAGIEAFRSVPWLTKFLSAARFKPKD